MNEDTAPDLPSGVDVPGASRLVSQAVLAAYVAQQSVAEFVGLACARAAATLDGVEILLGRRSGSWEASALRDLLLGTVGHDEEYLADHHQPELDEWLDRRLEGLS